MNRLGRILNVVLLAAFVVVGVPCAALGGYGIYVVIADWSKSPVAKEVVVAPMMFLLGLLLLKGAYDFLVKLRNPRAARSSSAG